MAVAARTASGTLKFRALRPGGRIAVVAPASAFDRAQFDAGLAELRRLGFDPVYEETVFDRALFSAGAAETRAQALMRAFLKADVDAVMAVRGGYGSVEALPLLDADRIRDSRRPFIGYSDVTSLHAYLGAVAGLASVYGPMLEGRFGKGPAHYDEAKFLRSVSDEPMGDVAPEGLETLQPGEAVAPLAGGTLTQLLASFETPYVFQPPRPHVLLLEDVGERPYRIHRMLTQWRLAGRLEHASAIVFGQFPQCDEPNSPLRAIDAIRDALSGFPGPVLFGFPAGHALTPLISLPLGVRTRVVGGSGTGRIVLEEAAGYRD